MFVYNKEIAFLDIACEHLKISKTAKKVYLYEIEHGHEFSPSFWERIVGKIANVAFIDAHGIDFLDYSEAKTGSTRSEKTGGVQGQISNVTNKIGHIRAAIFNSHKNKIDYFLLPPTTNCTVSISNNTNRGSIKFSYNRKEDTYANQLQIYRKEDMLKVCGSIESFIFNKNA